MRQLEAFVFDYLETYLDHSKYIFHAPSHTRSVCADVRIFAEGSDVSEEERNLLSVAALFHDTGYTVKPLSHENGSVELARKYLPEFGFSQDEIDTVATWIMATRMGAVPESLPEMLLRDADIGYLGTDRFESEAELLRRELTAQGRTFSDPEWIRFEAGFLNTVKFYSPAARCLRGEKLEEHRRKYEQLLKALRTDA